MEKKVSIRLCVLDLAVWLRQEYALCVNVSCLSCEPELNLMLK